MRFQRAIIREQNVTFAIAIVKEHVIRCQYKARSVLSSFKPVFPGMPIVLMAQDRSGRPAYFGRKDITRFLTKVPMNAIPWREYSFG